MNKLEQLGLKQLINELYSALKRCSKDNAERMEHERLFIEGDIKRAIEIAEMLQQNNQS